MSNRDRSRVPLILLVCGIALLARSARAQTSGLSEAAQTSGGCEGFWSIVPSPNVGVGNNELYALAVLSADDIWATGRFSLPTGYLTLAMHWDGNLWVVVPTPNVGTRLNQLYSLAAVAPDDIWAVGASSNDNLVYQTMIQHWDGVTWTVVPGPVTVGTSAFLYGAVALAADDVWAVGYTNIGTAAQLTLIEHWDGSAWSTVSSPNPSLNRDILWNISAASAQDVWACGNSYDGTNFGTLIVHWDGSQWTAVPSADGPSINFLWGIEAVSANDVWALGRTYNGTDWPTLIERWDGSAWNLVPHPDRRSYNEFYDAASVSTDDVWAVGRHGGGFEANLALISHWDGTAWSVVTHPLPAGSSDSFLNAAKSVDAKNVWAVGAYANDAAFRFETLIMQYSDTCATTSVGPAAPPPATVVGMTFMPNPARVEANLRFELARAGSVNLAIYDPQGRRVATLIEHRLLAAGPHDVALRTKALGPGFYVARLTSGGEKVATQKLLVIR